MLEFRLGFISRVQRYLGKGGITERENSLVSALHASVPPTMNSEQLSGLGLCRPHKWCEVTNRQASHITHRRKPTLAPPGTQTKRVRALGTSLGQ